MPVITTIVGVHLFLNPQDLPMAAIMVACSLLLLQAYWPQCKGLGCEARRELDAGPPLT